jgi:hypothetical protein
LARPRTPLLSRERIVTAALALIDAEGLHALSTRRLAAELGVSGPSLYNHVATKDELIDAVVDSVVAGVDVSAFGGLGVGASGTASGSVAGGGAAAGSGFDGSGASGSGASSSVAGDRLAADSGFGGSGGSGSGAEDGPAAGSGFEGGGGSGSVAGGSAGAGNVGGVRRAGDVAPAWRLALTSWARSYRAALAAHPNVVPALAQGGTGRRPAQLRIADAVFGGLVDAGWPRREATSIGALMRSLVIGSALGSFAGSFPADASVYAGVYPHLDQAHLLAEHQREIDERAFEVGLTAVLDGLELRLAALNAENCEKPENPPA